MKTSSVFIIGNGFDLAHNLPTSYNDFFYLHVNKDQFIKKAHAYNDNSVIENGDEKYFEDRNEKIDLKVLGEIYDLLKDNIWIRYFDRCGANIKGWIDFENEMSPALKFWKDVFQMDPIILRVSDDKFMAEINLSRQWHVRQAQAFADSKVISRIVNNREKHVIYINSEYVHENYGIIQEKIIELLRKDLDVYSTLKTGQMVN